jgi:glycosyltransferase involved in cell wall biosynthesis
MKKLQIDIIMPCYYYDHIVENAIKNIAKQQTRHHLHLIMINDCSPFTEDGYQSLVKKYQNILDITLIKSNHNSGPGVCRQMGISIANGDFILFHDDDDELVDEYAIENLTSSIGDSNIELIRTITGGILLDTVDGITKWSGKDNITLQATLYNTKYIKLCGVQFRDFLSFKEEDGAFLFDFVYLGYKYPKMNQMQDLIIPDNCYIYHRKAPKDHISLTTKCQFSESIIALINLLYANLLTIKENIEEIADEAKIRTATELKINIPSFWDLLYSEAFQSRYIFSKYQIDFLEKSLNEIIDYVETTSFTMPFDESRYYIGGFPHNSYYKWDTFKKDYQIQLETLKICFTKKE